MNLRYFHFVFIVASIALAVVVGIWCLNVTKLGAFAAFAAAAALVVYLFWFVAKMRRIR